VRAKKEAWESHLMLSIMQKNVREWTFTLSSELSFWELESWWTPESLKSNCKGENPLDWNFPYIIENIMEFKCLKWDHMTHLNT
jgi:hypothetical protein